MKFKTAIKPYHAAAGGLGSLEATTRFVIDSKNVLKNMRNLLRMNKARGFDCPGCTWGDDNSSSPASASSSCVMRLRSGRRQSG
ncbi:hypothetical protein [Kosakonia oryziphila]|uniref:Oxidoreductase alpha (Molybdopterin) subunit n=1 Tax=Kosakonia oryziphila TaxID=1005667 RepID=A0A1C4BAR6_9ENTR|nr:hypothetical protein GA0061070_100755 [Kosakonia oryziphila]